MEIQRLFFNEYVCQICQIEFRESWIPSQNHHLYPFHQDLQLFDVEIGHCIGMVLKKSFII